MLILLSWLVIPEATCVNIEFNWYLATVKYHKDCFSFLFASTIFTQILKPVRFDKWIQFAAQDDCLWHRRFFWKCSWPMPCVSLNDRSVKPNVMSTRNFFFLLWDWNRTKIYVLCTHLENGSLKFHVTKKENNIRLVTQNIKQEKFNCREA